MKMREGIKEMRKIAGEDADISPHYGKIPAQDRAIQVFNCWPETARRIIGEFIKKFGGTPAYAPGFHCAWLPNTKTRRRR